MPLMEKKALAWGVGFAGMADPLLLWPGSLCPSALSCLPLLSLPLRLLVCIQHFAEPPIPPHLRFAEPYRSS